MRIVLVVFLLLAPIARSADLREMKEAATIRGVFPAAAKLRVVNLWATWCVPCVAEMPDLRAIDETFGSEVAFAAVSMDDAIPGDRNTTKKKVAAFIDKQKIAFPIVYYTGKLEALADFYDFSGEIPVTLVFDRNGKELWRHEGRLDKQQTIEQLRKLLRRTK